MKRILLPVLLLLCSVAATAGEPPAQYEFQVGAVARSEMVRKIADLLSTNGYQITFVNAELGIITAERHVIEKSEEVRFVAHIAILDKITRLLTYKIVHDVQGRRAVSNAEPSEYESILVGMASLAPPQKTQQGPVESTPRR